MTRYGVEHNWKNPDNRKKCEDTCLALYGKHSWEIAIENLPRSKTKIERKISDLLTKHSYDHKQQFRIYFQGRKFKQYDFYLPKYNLLIEADGDYWHGNHRLYLTLNETQITNQKNDSFKEFLAKDKNYSLIRYWESDILATEFESQLLFDIQSMKKTTR